jgi:hypothetical protein
MRKDYRALSGRQVIPDTPFEVSREMRFQGHPNELPGRIKPRAMRDYMQNITKVPHIQREATAAFKEKWSAMQEEDRRYKEMPRPLCARPRLTLVHRHEVAAISQNPKILTTIGQQLVEHAKNREARATGIQIPIGATALSRVCLHPTEEGHVITLEPWHHVQDNVYSLHQEREAALVVMTEMARIAPSDIRELGHGGLDIGMPVVNIPHEVETARCQEIAEHIQDHLVEVTRLESDQAFVSFTPGSLQLLY